MDLSCCNLRMAASIGQISPADSFVKINSAFFKVSHYRLAVCKPFKAAEINVSQPGSQSSKFIASSPIEGSDALLISK